jgi:transcriptional regulator with XRE-family HTH domain
MKAEGLSIRDLAQMVGLSRGLVGDTLAGRRRAPDEEAVVVWAKALRLTGDDRKAFVLAAGMARADGVVQRRVTELETEVRELRARLG